MRDKYHTSFILSKIWASKGLSVHGGVGKKGAVQVCLTLNLFLPFPPGRTSQGYIAVGESALCVSQHVHGEIRSLALVSPPCSHIYCIQAITELTQSS